MRLTAFKAPQYVSDLLALRFLRGSQNIGKRGKALKLPLLVNERYQASTARVCNGIEMDGKPDERRSRWQASVSGEGEQWGWGALGGGGGWIQADLCVCVCCCVSQWVSSALAPAGNASTKQRHYTHHPPFTPFQPLFDEGNTIHARRASQSPSRCCLKGNGGKKPPTRRVYGRVVTHRRCPAEQIKARIIEGV